MNNSGKVGEELACSYLSSHHYTIFATNYYVHWGEIDIVAHKNNTLYFIEVKTRTHSVFTEQETFSVLSYTKKKRLLRSISSFFEREPAWCTVEEWQCDLLTIILFPTHARVIHQHNLPLEH